MTIDSTLVGVLVGLSAWSLSCDGGGTPTPQSLSDAGEPSEAGAGQALCGHEGEPCCELPLSGCAEGTSCDPVTQRCAASPPTSASELCRSTADCAATETCCAAGLLSTCVALPPDVGCPTIDLSIEAPASAPLLLTSFVEPLTCASGCLNTTGRHRLLRVDARVINSGTSDLLLGAPGAPGVRVSTGTVSGLFVGCPEYSYAEDLVRFELLSSDGETYSRIDARLSPGCLDAPAGSFDCSFLGLTRGVYSTALGCIELPLDGVPPGDYTLRFSIDPEGQIAESDESNNTFDVNVSLPRVDVLSECPPLPVGWNALQADCGWAPALTGTCSPGEVVSLGCPTCYADADADPLLRACAGADACAFLDALASNDDDGASGTLCPKVTFPCPVEGSYSSFVKHYVGKTGTCEVTREMAATPTGMN